MVESLAAGLRVLHLAENPNDDYLLGQELAQQGLPAGIVLVASGSELLRRVESERFDVLIVDLPLPEDMPPEVFDDLAIRQPQLSTVFRWGSCGARHSELPAEQLGRRIREALRIRIDRPQDDAARAGLVSELVRHQSVDLELAQEDLWDFRGSVRKITEAMADLLRVERVSVWELGVRGDMSCVDLYVRSSGFHGRGDDLPPCPRYLASLQRSLTLATSDARIDPRTAELRHDYLLPLGITGMLDAPIRRDGRVVGVLCHEFVGNEPRNWTLLEQCTAAKSANLVARALEVRDRRRADERALELQKFEAAGSVAKGVAHDMNNLLTVLVGNLVQLETEVTGAEQRESVASARQAVAGMVGLVRDLATIGQANRLHRRRLDLAAWMGEQERLLRSAVAPRVRLVVENANRPLFVEADREALSRVLLNLVKNASESISGPGTVQVELRADERSVVLSVDDDGAGMDEATRARIFEPYFTRHGQDGRGLGLATVMGLVRQHGGRIDVQTSPGQGSRFEVSLPRAPDVAVASEGELQASDS